VFRDKGYKLLSFPLKGGITVENRMVETVEVPRLGNPAKLNAFSEGKPNGIPG
jgi:hypothetical protein